MSHPHRRLQRAFFIIALILIALLLYWFFDSYLKQQQNPNQRPESYTVNGARQVILKPNASHGYHASGTINGVAVEFIVDTGASQVALSPQLAQRLALRRGQPRQLITANGSVTGYTTRLNQLTLGNIQLRNISAVINPGMHGSQVLFGMSALKYLTLTKRNGLMILRQE